MITLGDPYRTPSRPVPPRTVFVNPLVFYCLTRRSLARKPDAAAAAAGLFVPAFARLAFKAGDETWEFRSDPDCPTDYSWPVMGSPEYAAAVPPEVAEVVRAGIEDARKA